MDIPPKPWFLTQFLIAGSLHLPVLPPFLLPSNECTSEFLNFPHLWPTQEDDPKGGTCGFKDEHQDAALAKTCTMFNTGAAMNI